MKKKKRNKKKKRVVKKQSSSMFYVLFGLALFIVAIISCSQFGLFSRQIINCFRFFVGESHYIASVLVGIIGLLMIIYNKPIKMGWKKNIGLFLIFIGLTLWQSGIFFTNIMVNQGFISSFITIIHTEFTNGQNANNVGGGLLGTIAYNILFPLVGLFGIRTIAILAIISGLLMLFDVKFNTLISKFQKNSQQLIKKNKQVAKAVKGKYSDYVEHHQKRKKTSNQENLSDPYDNQNNDIFPNTEDFIDTKDSLKSEDKQIPIQTQDSNSLKVETELPKSHAFETDDNKIRQELAGVQHGEFEEQKSVSNYQIPPLDLLNSVNNVDQSKDKKLIQKNIQILESTFKNFGVKVIVKKAVLGPTVTRYEVQPAVGVKVSRIVNLADDLSLALAAKDIRIEAPIPGKPLVGIEVPNKVNAAVSFKEVILNQDSRSKQQDLSVPLGKDVTGEVVSADLRKMPHLLIAGSTGSGKSVAINTIITSILMKAHPDDVKLVLIDPKMVELSVYSGIPHLLIPVVTDAKLATNAFKKTVQEMERRYKLFAAGGVRNINEYNQKVNENNGDKNNPVMEKLPYVVLIVDELSDLMMVAGHDVETAIVRLAQMARAAGIHMILATQRPSVDVITGLIKANVPSRISFAVSSGIDSRTILDQIGAEKLLGKGDMLFLPIGASKPERIQGAFISVDEVENIVEWVKNQQEANYNENMIPVNTSSDSKNEIEDEPEDELYQDAVELVTIQQAASVSMLQRRFRIGYNRAARIVDTMEAHGIVGPSEGSKPRKVLVSKKENEAD